MDPKSGNTPSTPVTKPANKLFSRSTFIAGSIVGGPLAATYFFYKNFKNEGNRQAANLSVLLGLIISVALFVLALTLPTIVNPRFDRALFPAIYVGITIALFRRFQEEKVKQHLAADGELYTSRGAGVVLVCIVISILLFFGSFKAMTATGHSNLGIWDVLGLAASNYDRQAYEQKIHEFTQNDQRAITDFNQGATGTRADTLKALEDGIARYNRNNALLNEIDAMDNLPSILQKNDSKLRTYTNLRLQHFALMKKAVTEDTAAYNSQLQTVIGQLKKYVSNPGGVYIPSSSEQNSEPTVTPSSQPIDIPITVNSQPPPQPEINISP